MTDQELQAEIDRLNAERDRTGIRLLSVLACACSALVGVVTVQAGAAFLPARLLFALALILLLSALPEMAMRVKR